MTPTNPQFDFTPFLPTSYDFPKDEDLVAEFICENFANFADVVNDKVIGAFTESAENINGTKWAYDTTKKIRNGYQAIARVASWIPQTIPMPIGNINPQFIISLAYGSASLPCTAVGANDGDYFSFFSQGDVRIQFTMSDTEIVITTNGTTAGYSGFIVIEYIRDGV